MDLLEELPVKLRRSVEDYLEAYKDSQLLTTRVYEDRPYKDKSVVVVTHRVYIEWEVTERSMIVGDMKVFFQESQWFEVNQIRAEG